MAEKLPSGKYRTRATYTDEQGKRHSVSFTRNSAKEADYAALEFKLGKRRLSAASAISVGDALDIYIESNAAVLSPSTINGYNGYRRNNYHSIQDIPLRKLTPRMVQSWVNEQAATLSPKTVRNVYGLLAAALKRECPDALLGINLPQKIRREIIIPQRSEISAILDAARGTSLYLPILLAAHCGMRRSEICALTWKDINLKKKTIAVNKAMVTDGIGWVVKQPKSSAGYRTLDMSNAVYDYLSNADKKQPLISINPDTFTNAFGKLCAKLGMAYHPHALRHFYCSVLASSGIPMKYAQMLMGHSSGDMINKVYAHILKEDEERYRSRALSALEL